MERPPHSTRKPLYRSLARSSALWTEKAQVKLLESSSAVLRDAPRTVRQVAAWHSPSEARLRLVKRSGISGAAPRNTGARAAVPVCTVIAFTFSGTGREGAPSQLGIFHKPLGPRSSGKRRAGTSSSSCSPRLRWGAGFTLNTVRAALVRGRLKNEYAAAASRAEIQQSILMEEAHDFGATSSHSLDSGRGVGGDFCEFTDERRQAWRAIGDAAATASPRFSPRRRHRPVGWSREESRGPTFSASERVSTAARSDRFGSVFTASLSCRAPDLHQRGPHRR